MERRTLPLIDIRLPDLGGLEAARAIRAFHPQSRIVIVTSYDQPLRVLMIEDSQNDCELIVRHLRRCGFAPRVWRVDNGLELRRALEQDSC
jgi:CheY-like chemotaxis protein